ncbi:MAG: 2-isopropylmalate synthase, partial [Rhodospirillales bacterium]|nr:2-isopropylmalate synthase [Rhodospirillales bacterium]
MSTNSDSNRIIIFDTTLRDGEQSPGASMNLDEKKRIALVLEEMGVDVIEAGFPIASDGDFEAVNEIAKIVTGSTVCGLARAVHGDIDRAAEAIKPAKRGRIHTFISTSPLHMKYKLQMEPEDVHAAVIDSIKYARKFTDDVEWSPEDGSRTEHDFLCRCVESAIKAGAGTINIPDTVGYAVPQEFGALIEMLFNRVPNIDKAVISVHCHNDLGLAVSNTLAAFQAGARQVECTINGLGERAGNAAMEEVVMAIKTRNDRLPFTCNIKTEQIMKASRLVSAITGFSVQPNKAIVGANAFAHESGIHQDGMLKHSGTYEIMTPESVGLTKSTLVLGKHSGRHAFKEKLQSLGYGDLGENSVQVAFKRFKDLADKKKEVFDEDIVALVDDEVLRDNDRIRLISMEVLCGTAHRPPKAEMELEIDGKNKDCKATGDGPVDAAFNCVKALFPHQARLQLYQVHAVTGGTDAQAVVTVRLEERGKTVIGQG